ncbi:glycosyltransferase [Sphingomonas koreensis]
MRIVDVNGFYAPRGGGVRAYVDWKLAHAARTGHEVIVIAPGPEDRLERREGGAIQWVAAPPFPLDPRYRMFVDAAPVHRLLHALRPDVVEASSPWRTATIVAEWRGAAPRHWIMHADPLAAYAYRWFGRMADQNTIDHWFGWYWRHMGRLAPSFESIVCANDALSARLVQGGLANARTIRFGVEPNTFSPDLRDEDLRRSLLQRCGRPPEGLLLAGIGRHTAEKDWPLVISAVGAAAKQHEIALLLIGEGRDTARVAKAIGGDPHMQLLAPIHDRSMLARMLASVDGLIHGCEAETFCFVAAEAAASGVPAIVPSRGAAAEAAGAAACPYEAGNGASAAEAIARLAAARNSLPASARNAAAAGVRTMNDHFDDLFRTYMQPIRVAA